MSMVTIRYANFDRDVAGVTAVVVGHVWMTGSEVARTVFNVHFETSRRTMGDEETAAVIEELECARDATRWVEVTTPADPNMSERISLSTWERAEKLHADKATTDYYLRFDTDAHAVVRELSTSSVREASTYATCDIDESTNTPFRDRDVSSVGTSVDICGPVHMNSWWESSERADPSA